MIDAINKDPRCPVCGCRVRAVSWQLECSQLSPCRGRALLPENSMRLLEMAAVVVSHMSGKRLDPKEEQLIADLDAIVRATK